MQTKKGCALLFSRTLCSADKKFCALLYAHDGATHLNKVMEYIFERARVRYAGGGIKS